MRVLDRRVIGIVVAVYPDGNSLDVLLPKTGDRLTNVQCTAHTGSSNTGVMDLPDIGLPVDDSRWQIQLQGSGTRYVRAIIDKIDGMPICIGFLLPQLTQLTFARKNFRVSRHASDVYKTINAQGDMETYHPSGTYFRIGANPAHEDLTSQDVDQSWQITQNKSAAPYLNLTVANAGNTIATFQIDPSGNVNLTHKGNLAVSAGGNANLTVAGTTEVTSDGAVTVNSSAGTTHNGPLTVNGLLTFTQGMAGSGGAGNTVEIDGSANYTGDVKAGNISQIGHTHTSESPGTPTSPPIAGT